MKQYLFLFAFGIALISFSFSRQRVVKNNPPKKNYACGVSPKRINSKYTKEDKGFEMVFNPPYKWKKKELKVYFTDIYDYEIIEKTLKVANKWATEGGAGIKFTLSVLLTESDIRVAFRDNQGYQSLIGIEAESIEYSSAATMSLQNLDYQPEAEFNRVVLHEFGHAIGLEHELQSPNANIIWDTPAVYKFYDTAYNWEKAKVDFNVFGKVKTNAFTIFDPKSIMIYAVPSFLLKSGVAIPWPDNLSAIDKKTIKKYYP